MENGYLTVAVRTGDDALPVGDAEVSAYTDHGEEIFTTHTNANGQTDKYELIAPNESVSLDPNAKGPAYALYNVRITAKGFVIKYIIGIPIIGNQSTILPINLQPLVDGPNAETEEYVNLGPIALVQTVPNRQAVPPPVNTLQTFPEGEALIPDYITVHLGVPTDKSAKNVRIKFPEYIKNVVSNEIYSSWPQASLTANIHAIVTFALNRVFTEWYRSRDYNFDITNSTSYDMFYNPDGPVFENISKAVDEYFNVYAHRFAFKNPFFTQFCNGTTVTCPGLSQWGTVTLAKQGKDPLSILRNYYPKDLQLAESNNIGGIVASFPGTPISTGSQGDDVRRIQIFLNRIRVNYPLIPAILNPNGVFGKDTEDAVKVFQKTFDLTPDGIVGKGTWNKLNRIFVAVTRLGELESEGIRRTIGKTPPSVVLQLGATGAAVRELEFILDFIAPFYTSIPPVVRDGIFDAQTKNAVIEFQKTFGLTADGIVGPYTWNKLYEVYRGIERNVEIPS